jgi:signal peptidase II
LSSHSKRASIALFLVISAGCLGCDQLTKGIARFHLADGASTTMAGGAVRLTLVENPGAFLSLGDSLPLGLRTALLLVGVPIVLLVVCAAFLRYSERTPLDLVGIGLVVGGGLGNWLDRLLREGAVTDFVRLSVGPLHTGVFNAADVAIVLGVVMLLMSSWRREATIEG